MHIPHICHFFTQAKFLENKIYTKKRLNYDKLHSKLPLFRVKSVKIYTGKKKFKRAPPVAPVTNMRYADALLEQLLSENQFFQEKRLAVSIVIIIAVWVAGWTPYACLCLLQVQCLRISIIKSSAAPSMSSSLF